MANNENTFISFYLKSNTIRVSKKSLKIMGEPPYVRFLVNRDNQKMIMQGYDRISQISFRVRKQMCRKGSRETLFVHSKAFCLMIAHWMDWDEGKSYRIPGVVYPEQKIVLFNVSEATEIKSI